jgi:GT2 family glycosyltransferase
METKLTIVIPTLNNYKGLLRLLETLEKYTPPIYRVIVIHNGHTLDSPNKDLIDKIKPKVHLWIDTYRNLGFAKSMNTGIRLTNTEYVLCANDDVELMYDSWWQEVEALFASDPELGGFNPHSPCNKMHTGDRMLQYPYKAEYTPEDIENIKKIFLGQAWYVGCCTYFTIFRKKMFDDVGLYDESFGIGSGEDYDLCVRAARGKWKVAGGSKVIVWHWWGDTKDNMPVEVLNGISNYDLIAGGNQNMERKWSQHCDKLEGGWSVSGQGGPLTPLDKEINPYEENGKWWRKVPL